MAEEDLLWGKHRHLFGGIEPSNMLKFEPVTINGNKFIDARLPKDTVVDGQTLCTVAGAVIRRGENGFPKSEFEGELVADITADTLLPLSSFGDSAVNYFSAFPYTTQGVYTRNVVNRAVFGVTENFVTLEAKSRYIYDGGLPQNRVYNIDTTVTVPMEKLTDDLKVYLYIRGHDNPTGGPRRAWTIPASSIKSSKYSTDEVGVYHWSISLDEHDEDLSEGKEYDIYAMVGTAPYTGDSIITSGPNAVCCTVLVTKCNYLFGYDLDLNDSNPDTRVSYPADVDNAGFTPVSTNPEHGTFHYGDWAIAPGEKFMPKPCMLKYDGTVGHYLDPNDYSMCEDGITPSKVADVDYAGNAMMEWPKIYTHREEVDGVYKFRCSDSKLGADWDCWCNYDIKDNEIDHFYTSIYTACCPNEDATNGTRLRSISGQTTYSAEYYATVRSKALYRANSSQKYDSWDIGLLADHLLIQDLLIMMGKNTDCSLVYGNGAEAGTGYRSEKSGYMDTKGLFGISKGKSGDKKDGVKVFGMEHYWGNDWRHIAGWVIYNGKQYIKITKGAHDGMGSESDNVSARYNRFDSGYNNKKLTVSTTFATTSGYMGSTVTTPYGRLPINADGSISTYECDVISWSNSDLKVGMIGGSCNSAANAAGPFAVQAYSPSTSTSCQATTLSCKPVYPY